MNFAQKPNAIRRFRTAAVAIQGFLGLYATAYLCAELMRFAVANASMNDLELVVLCALIGGSLMTAICCFTVYHAFSLWGRTALLKAIRLNEAMRLLHATTHPESINTLRYHGINVFKSKTPLGVGVTEKVKCKIIPTFLSPFFLSADQSSALGSAYYCCDYDEIQSIIQKEHNKWGHFSQSSDAKDAKIAALEKCYAESCEEIKRVNGLYTSASGNGGRLKLQLEDVQKHMMVLIKLAHKVTHEIKPPRTLSREDIKRKYLAIGKLHGIDNAPAAYVELFREAMPKEYINQGGAPCQRGECTAT